MAVPTWVTDNMSSLIGVGIIAALIAAFVVFDRMKKSKAKKEEKPARSRRPGYSMNAYDSLDNREEEVLREIDKLQDEENQLVYEIKEMDSYYNAEKEKLNRQIADLKYYKTLALNQLDYLKKQISMKEQREKWKSGNS